jgi:PadR family transcriptional regulator PadR
MIGTVDATGRVMFRADVAPAELLAQPSIGMSRLWPWIRRRDKRTSILQALIVKEGYGLELIERVKALTNGRVVLVQGRVYGLLRGLERDGLIRSYDREAVLERGGRPRRYYELTEKGRRVASEVTKTI